MDFATITDILGIVLKPLWEKATADLKGSDVRAAFKRIFIKANQAEEFKEIETKATLNDKDVALVMEAVSKGNANDGLEEEMNIIKTALNITENNRYNLAKERITSINVARKNLERHLRQANRGGVLADDALGKVENLEYIIEEHERGLLRLLFG